MSDPQRLPPNTNYITLPKATTLAELKAVIGGMESTANPHPVNGSYPTTVKVNNVYSAIINTSPPQEGYVITWSSQPFGGIPASLAIQAVGVNGADDEAKAQNAAVLIGASGTLIGYEDFGGVRVVIFRAAQAVAVPAGVGHLSWETGPLERVAWSQVLLGQIANNQQKLEQGNPEGFIPGYNSLSGALKVKFWAELLVAMAKFESSWNPNCVFKEPPPLGVNSIGLLQLSLKDGANYGGLQPSIGQENQLKDPTINLKWGVAIFTHWMMKDKVVASGSGDPGGSVNPSRGSARYWSVMRAGHKIELIRAMTKIALGL